MQREVEQSLSQSARLFSTLVWPAISPLCGGGTMQPVESVTEKGFTDVLDAHAGIDAWQIIKNKSVVRGIASRVQPTGKSYNTFTIRYQRASGARTEYSKRREALLNREKGYLYPHLTVQAFVSKDERVLLDAAVICTADLFQQADRVVFRHESDAPCKLCVDAAPNECLCNFPLYPTRGKSCTAYQLLSQKDIGGIRPGPNANFIWLSWDWLVRVGARISILSQSQKEAA